MKNECLGDIRDYGKYGLLRFLAEHHIKIGVNWYLTKDDQKSNKKYMSYLEKDKDWFFDEELFDFLKAKAFLPNKNVKMIEEENLIQDAIFYSKELTQANRQIWHSQALESLQEAELIFTDADNGTIGMKRTKNKDSEKYILPSEIMDYYNRGQSVVYLCQRARRKESQWDEVKAEMKELLPEAKFYVLTYHKGQQCSYIFVIQPKDYRRYINVIYQFLRTSWGRVFDEEYINGQNPAEEKVGKTLKIELTDGTIMSISAQVDGWVEIRYSDQPTVSRKVDADYLAKCLGR